MPEGMFALFVFPFKKLYRGILTDWARNVPVLAIDFSGKDISCKPRADAFGNLKGSHSGFKLLYTSIWKSYIYHMSVDVLSV